MFYVYCIENISNNKLYIGKSSNPSKRWITHKAIARGGPQIYKDRYHYFHRAIAKYGTDNFKLYIVHGYSSEDECFRAEEYWVSYLRDFGLKLYNSTNGGGGPVGMKHSAESKKKMGQHHVYKSGQEHFRYGIKHTPEVKLLMSKIAKDKKAGSRNPMIGMPGELAYAYGRTGDKHPNTKLSDQKLIEVKQEIASGKVSLTSLAWKYKVSVSLLSQIKHNKARTKC